MSTKSGNVQLEHIMRKHKKKSRTLRVKKIKHVFGFDLFYTVLPNGRCAMGFTPEGLKNRVRFLAKC